MDNSYEYITFIPYIVPRETGLYLLASSFNKLERIESAVASVELNFAILRAREGKKKEKESEGDGKPSLVHRAPIAAARFSPRRPFISRGCASTPYRAAFNCLTRLATRK